MSTTVTVVRTHNDSDIPVAGVYSIDPAHTSVEFVGRHLMITKVRGRLPEVSGMITVAEDPEQSHVDVEIGVAGLDTGNADRDMQLRGADFFDVENHPTMTFRSTKVEATRTDAWLVTGDLTVRGVTHPIALQVDFDGASASPLGDQRIAFSAAAEINREDWGLTWNMALETGGVLVGKKVAIELNVQAVAN
jgi:polyisoprenoid-binding protein YceI